MAERLGHFRDELRQRDEARGRLLEQVITAQEEERRRIARELHDETGQSLTSLTLGLASITRTQDVGAIHQQAAELRALAGRTLDEVHNLSRGLRPSILDDLGLVPALERHLQEYQSRGLRVDLHTLGLEGRLPGPVEIAVYRIVQEALTNIVKHANAKSVAVSLQRERDHWILRIADDGIGIDLAKPQHSTGHGLLSMRERARALGGEFLIRGEAGHGTVVEIKLAAEAAPG
jgi:signal transduction histidine kinase